eukprot:g42978.t1
MRDATRSPGRGDSLRPCSAVLLVRPDSIHICAVVVEYMSKAGRINRGVATTWLRDKIPTDNDHKPTVPMYVRKSQFRLPYKPSTPVLMIGPGTGIAPFVGLLYHSLMADLLLNPILLPSACNLLIPLPLKSLSIFVLNTLNDWASTAFCGNEFHRFTILWLKKFLLILVLRGKEVGETVLYYGCRYQNEDYLYQEELEQYQKDGILTQLNVAFSRDQAEKVSHCEAGEGNLLPLSDLIF